MKQSTIQKSNLSNNHIKWRVLSALISLWVLIIIPLCLVEYFYIRNELLAREANKRTFQEDVLSKIFEQRARYGDFINTRANVEALGQAFGLKKVLVCKDGSEIFGNLTAINCPSNATPHQLLILDQTFDLFYIWDNSAKDLKNIILFSIAISLSIGLLLFALIGGTVYFVLLKNIDKLAKEIVSLSITESAANLTSQLPALTPIVHSIYEMKKRIEDDSKHLNQLKTFEALGLLAKQVAHDIRSPLSALKMLIDTGNLNKSENADLAKSAIHRIDGIAVDLLNRQSIKEKKFLSSDNLSAFLEFLIQIKKTEANNKNIKCVSEVVSSANSPITYNLSEDTLFRMLSNLINNSIEATTDERENTISIFATAESNKLIFRIEDTGRGITKKNIERILTTGGSFGKQSSNKSGYGLGLSYVRNETQNCGGDFLIDSNENVGTTITLTFPEAPKNK